MSIELRMSKATAKVKALFQELSSLSQTQADSLSSILIKKLSRNTKSGAGICRRRTPFPHPVHLFSERSATTNQSFVLSRLSYMICNLSKNK